MERTSYCWKDGHKILSEEIKLELSFVGSVAGNQKKKGVKDIPGRRERIYNDGGHEIACYL